MREGCGRVEIATYLTVDIWSQLFDVATSALVGSTTGSDTGIGVCGPTGYTFGEAFDCDLISECTLCPEAEPLPDVFPCET